MGILIVLTGPGMAEAKTGWALLLKGPLAAAALLVTSEWLFMATKPSFMSGLSYPGKLGIWLVAVLLTLACLYAVLVLAGLLLSLVLRAAGPRVFLWLAAGANALLWTCLAVLLVDNFTYSLFRLGVRSIESAWVSAVALLFVTALAVLVFRRSLKPLPAPGPEGWKRGLAMAAYLPVAALLLQPPGGGLEVSGTAREANHNVVIIGVDALEAGHMSLYGYHRETTPFLDSIRGELLVAGHSFTNNSASFGSIGSMLTGKYPATTRLVFPPNVLTGEDQFEHLPGLLRDMGYRSMDMSLRWYTEARAMNLRCAFDEANFRRLRDCDLMPPALRWALVRFSGSFLLLDSIHERAAERLELLIPWVENPTLDKDLSRVGQPPNYWRRDDERLAAARRLMAAPDERPFFINFHLMGLHGGKPLLDNPHFSRGQELDGFWETDFYDDAVLRLDRQIGELYAWLESLGKLETTLLVITSDHGINWDITAPLPLIMRFPGGAPHGLLPGNTQRLDIAPTVLSALGAPVPEWMEGDALIGAAVPDLHARPIVQVSPPSGAARHRGGRIMLEFMAPPFWSVGSVHVISCDQQFTWNLRAGHWGMEKIGGQSDKCHQKALTDSSVYIAMAREHLVSRGYDLSAVADPRALARPGNQQENQPEMSE